jgi:hypothetical protein
MAILIPASRFFVLRAIRHSVAMGTAGVLILIFVIGRRCDSSNISDFGRFDRYSTGGRFIGSRPITDHPTCEGEPIVSQVASKSRLWVNEIILR